jgi:hypothetical protein
VAWAGDTKRHYEQFVVEAVAMDRLAARQSPQGNYIAAREWSREPVKLFATMYELTETVCHNYWCVFLSIFWFPPFRLFLPGWIWRALAPLEATSWSAGGCPRT